MLLFLFTFAEKYKNMYKKLDTEQSIELTRSLLKESLFNWAFANLESKIDEYNIPLTTGEIWNEAKKLLLQINMAEDKLSEVQNLYSNYKCEYHRNRKGSLIITNLIFQTTSLLIYYQIFRDGEQTKRKFSYPNPHAGEISYYYDEEEQKDVEIIESDFFLLYDYIYSMTKERSIYDLDFYDHFLNSFGVGDLDLEYNYLPDNALSVHENNSEASIVVQPADLISLTLNEKGKQHREFLIDSIPRCFATVQGNTNLIDLSVQKNQIVCLYLAFILHDYLKKERVNFVRFIYEVCPDIMSAYQEKEIIGALNDVCQKNKSMKIEDITIDNSSTPNDTIATYFAGVYAQTQIKIRMTNIAMHIYEILAPTVS